MKAQLTKTRWSVDSNHSVVQFRVKHLAVSTITGTFQSFQGACYGLKDNLDSAEVFFEINAKSLNTNHEVRDSHLRGEDFFHVDKYPNIIFKGILNTDSSNYKLIGDLTIREITRPIELLVELTGSGKGRNGDNRIGFEIDGNINRKDFGLTWSMLTETGGLIVGDEIKLHFDIQLVEQ